MKHTVKLPKLTDAADDVLIIDWLVDEGDVVSAGMPVLLVETTKVETEVVSPVSGVLSAKLVDVEAEVPVGAPLFIVDATGR